MSSTLFSIQNCTQEEIKPNFKLACYSIFLFKGKGSFLVDFIEYSFSGNTILFLSPYQNFQWLGTEHTPLKLLTFHGDFYCIEYHKREVACNGLLFNNIYLKPHVTVDTDSYNEIEAILGKMTIENAFCNPYSEAILKTYLQLILALCSKVKGEQIEQFKLNTILEKEIVDFQKLLENYFINEKSPSFYATKLALTTSAFSKKIKKQFGKSPSQLIQERVILEAKKLLHLTHKSVKEIAFELGFEDEFYFSRYFKKGTELSPLHYREQVGISNVAK